MFAHPEIDVPMMKATMAAGHMAACDKCSELLMGGKLEALVTRALMRHGMGLEDVPAVRREFREIYEKVSRQREVAIPIDEYNRLYPEANGIRSMHGKGN